MGTRYHVKTATMTFGSSSYEMKVGPAAKGQTRDETEVSSLGDVFKQFIPGALTEDDALTVTISDKGPNNRPKTSDAPAALAFAVKLSNGEDPDVEADFSYVKAFVTKVSPPNLDGGGDRGATIDVAFRPTGEQPAATPAATAAETPAAGEGAETPAAGGEGSGTSGT